MKRANRDSRTKADAAPRAAGNLNVGFFRPVSKRLPIYCRAVVLLGLLGLVSLPRLGAHGTHSSLMAAVNRQLAEEPESAALLFRRALLQFEHEDLAAALRDLQRVELLSNAGFPTLWWKGRIFEQQGDLQKAKLALDDFLKQSPLHSGGLASRARVGLKLGQTESALGDYRGALANHPAAEPDLVIEVAQALAANGHDREAVRVLDQGVARLGSIPSLNLKILEIEVNANRHDAALARLDGMRQSAPRPEPWMERRAMILALAGRSGQSRHAWGLLVHHLKSLPPSERDSHAMSLLLERSNRAIAALDSEASSNNPFYEFTKQQNP